MLFARLQDQLAMTTGTVGWCAVSTESSEGLAYRQGNSTAAISKQIAHRGSFSGLCVRVPAFTARLGNPEDKP